MSRGIARFSRTGVAGLYDIATAQGCRTSLPTQSARTLWDGTSFSSLPGSELPGGFRFVSSRLVGLCPGGLQPINKLYRQRRRSIEERKYVTQSRQDAKGKRNPKIGAGVRAINKSDALCRRPGSFEQLNRSSFSFHSTITTKRFFPSLVDSATEFSSQNLRTCRLTC